MPCQCCTRSPLSPPPVGKMSVFYPCAHTVSRFPVYSLVGYIPPRPPAPRRRPHSCATLSSSRVELLRRNIEIAEIKATTIRSARKHCRQTEWSQLESLATHDWISYSPPIRLPMKTPSDADWTGTSFELLVSSMIILLDIILIWTGYFVFDVRCWETSISTSFNVNIIRFASKY